MVLGRRARGRFAVGLYLSIGAAACNNTAAPTKDTPPAATAQTSASASGATATSAPGVPTLIPENFAPGGSKPSQIFAVEGALMVVEGRKVGRIAKDEIEWLAKTIPEGGPAFGENIVRSVHGYWPDGVGVVFTTSNGRALMPTYQPLTGKGVQHVAGEGGALGSINGVAHLGETTLLAVYSMEQHAHFVTVRGPKLTRQPQSHTEGGCKPGEVWRITPESKAAALSPRTFEASPAGTLVSLGDLCDQRTAAAEVWDAKGKSRIVDLGTWWKKTGYSPVLLRGTGDELWAYSDDWRPILRYKDGEFSAVADLGRPIRSVFTSARGELHASDGRTVYRLDNGNWVALGRFAEAQTYRSMAMDEEGALWAADGAVYRLRAGDPAPPAAECATPFVYLYEVASTNAKDFTFPSTRAALSKFPAAADIGLVEFEESSSRQLGVTVTSKAQGEALVAHVQATMKEERPRLFCYEPKAPRKIPLSQ